MPQLRVMTFNVLGPSCLDPADPLDAAHAWPRRAALNLRTVARYRPDLVGLQEVEAEPLEAYRRLEGYAVLEGDPTLTSNPMLYRPDRLAPLEAGHFWLGPTPDEFSRGWGVEDPLTATWGRFGCREDGSKIVFLNTQFEDGPAETARLESARLVVTRLERLAAGRPAVAAGDFNCNPFSAVHDIFTAAGFADAHRAAGHSDSAASSTFHGLQGERYFGLEWGGDVFWRVDWVLARGGLRPARVKSCTTAKDAEPPLYPSDHYPVVAELVL